MKILGVTGWKNCGKTTLVSRLVVELTARGYSVSTVKRTHHNVDLDRPGTDTFKHREAGAQEVIFASDKRYAIMREFREEPMTLEAMIARLDPVDIVVVEGFKFETHAKIECHRQGGELPLIAADNDTVIAVATDVPIEAPVPLLALDDIPDITDFALAKLGLPKEGPAQ